MRKLLAATLLLLATSSFAEDAIFIGHGGGSAAAGGGGGSTFATDNFDRADGDLHGDTASGGGTWTDPALTNSSSELNVVSNVIQTDDSSDWDAYYHSTNPPSNEYYVQASVFVAAAGNNSLGPAIQVLDHNNFITCYWSGGEGDWNIRKYVAGGLSLIDDGEVTNPPTTARTVKLSRSGTTYTCTVDGTTVATGTDTSFSNAEKAGIMTNFSATTATIDNFEAGQ